MKINDEKKTIYSLKEEISQYEIDKHVQHGYTVRVKNKYGTVTHFPTY